MTAMSDWKITTILIFVVAGFVYFAEPLLFPILLAAVFFFLLHPLIRISTRLRIPKYVSSTVILVMLVGSGVAAVAWLKDPAVLWLERAPQNLAEVERKLSVVKKPIERIFDATERVEEIASLSSDNRDIEVKVNAPKLGSAVFELTGSALLMLGSALVLLYFFLIYGEHFIERLVPIVRTRRSGDGLRRIEVEISRCFLTVTVINACLGCVIGTVLWLYGVPNAPLWGAMAGILNFLPYVGAVTGSAIVAFVSLITFDNIWYQLLPPLSYFLINALEGQVITPMLLGQRLRLNPLLLLLSMMVWGWAWGLKGVLLSVPLMVILKVVSDHVGGLRNVSRIMEV